jgi:hypothetical protein
MNPFLYATHSNIKRLQNLLDTSVGPTERQTLQRLIAEERAKAKLQALEANRPRSGKEEGRGRVAQTSLQASLLESLTAAIKNPFRRASLASPPGCSTPQPTTTQSKGSQT